MLPKIDLRSMIPMELLTMCCPISIKLGHSVELSFVRFLVERRLSFSV